MIVLISGSFKGNELRTDLVRTKERGRTTRHPFLKQYTGVVFTPSEGKYVTTLSTRKELSAALAKRLKLDFDSVDCKLAPEVTDLQPFIWEGFDSCVAYTYRIDLSDLNRAWDGIEAAVRNVIRRAGKDG